MTFDPLGAFALACNVLQVVEYGSKMVLSAAELYRGANGGPSQVNDMVSISERLSKISELLAKATNIQPSTTQSSIEKQLYAAHIEAYEVSQTFAAVIQKFLPSGDSIKMKIQSLRNAFLFRWRKEELDGLEKKLGHARSNLILAFLLYMYSKPNDAQRPTIQANDTFEKRILDAMACNTTNFSDKLEALAQQLGDLKIDRSRSNDTIRDFEVSNQAAILKVTLALENIVLAQGAFRSKQEKGELLVAQQRLCDSLYYPELNARRDQVVEAHKDTFKWTLDPDPWAEGDHFLEWLQSPDEEKPIYWVNGKPGSGKSTLIRYLQQHIGPAQYSRWVGSKNLWQGNHFFWSPGAEIEKSLRGGLQSLLHQILSDNSWLIEIVVDAKRWASTGISDLQPKWTLHELKTTMLASIERLTLTSCVLLFVDGLDEIAGSDAERESALEIFTDLARLQGVKLCASSRPWNMFQDAFRGVPTLLLQDLTRDAIEHFVRDSLGESASFQHFSVRDNVEGDDLIEAIIDKANGVFLWVRLVVYELRRGIRDGGSTRSLRRIVDSIPADLDEYFQRIILSIDPAHRKEGSATLQTILFTSDDSTTLWPRRLLDLSYLDLDDPAFALQPEVDFDVVDPLNETGWNFFVDLMKRRLNSRCMGLLEVSVEPPRRAVSTERLFGPQVRFLHRSLFEYLRTPTAQQLLESLSGGPFPARLYLCNVLLTRAMVMGDVVVKSLNRVQRVRNAMILGAMLDRTLTVASSSPDLLTHEAWDKILQITRPLFAHVFKHAERMDSEMEHILALWESWDIYQRSTLARILGTPHAFDSSMDRIAREYGHHNAPEVSQRRVRKAKRSRKTNRNSTDVPTKRVRA